jgi:Ran GTPase-activating protein (RanGAP) involved in mRNA processing and transport
LANCGLGGVQVESLSEILIENKDLKYLYLKGNEFGDRGAKGLGRFISTSKSILELDLYCCGI